MMSSDIPGLAEFSLCLEMVTFNCYITTIEFVSSG